MLKGSQALFAAIESGSPVPTNERQAAELAKHTVWKISERDGCRAIVDANGRDVVYVDRAPCFYQGEPCGSMTSRGRTANELRDIAHLLAAAPCLLEACRTTLETLRWALSTRPANGSTDPRVMACVDLQETLEAAIAKAGGAK